MDVALLEVRFAVNESELRQAFNLRWEILRKAWNQPKGSEQDELEHESYTAIAMHEKMVVATGRVQLILPKVAQIRYMAVHKQYQGKGTGHLVLELLEKKALELGAKTITLNARDNAIPFYVRNKYVITGSAPTLYGVIPHVRMEKMIENKEHEAE